MPEQKATSNDRQGAGRRTRPRCCCENCDLDSGCQGDRHKGSGSELPRRCLVIKRTHPEEGIERTELRLVTYQKAGAKVDQAHVLMEAARYLQERADDADCSETRKRGGRNRPQPYQKESSFCAKEIDIGGLKAVGTINPRDEYNNASGRTKFRDPEQALHIAFPKEKSRSTCSSVFSTSATTKQTTRSTSNESKCSRSSKGSKESSRSSVASQGSKENRDLHRMIEQEQLRKSLENLVRYFAHRADESDDREWSMITGVAERLLLDVTDCIRKEKPLNHDLLARIRDLNKLARQATLQSGGDQKRKSEKKGILGRSNTLV